jgi:polyhydroxybutyrate depolymerase
MSEPFAIDVDGVRRTYRLHLPRGVGRVPLVVFLHGKGGTAEWAETETGWSDLADRKGFAVLYPEALPPRRDRAPKFLTNPPTWDDSPDSADLNFLLSLPVATTEVYLSGFSNGAAMAFRLAAAMPHAVRAIAPVSGYCRFEPDELPRPIPTLYLIGDADPVVPPEGGTVVTPWRAIEERPPVWEGLARWQRANRFFDKGVVTRDALGNRTREFLSLTEASMRVVVLAGLGHHWPGGKGGLGEKMGGPIVPTLDAAETIWEFFRAAKS